MKRTIGEQVAQYMADHSLKAGAMAKLVGTSRQNIEGLIKRDRFPRDYIERLASVMELSIDSLIAGEYSTQSSKNEIDDSGELSKDIANVGGQIGSSVEENGSAGDTKSALCQSIPTSMPFAPIHLKSAILLMGNLLGALDKRTKRMIGDLLKDLAEDTDDALDIAEKAEALAKTQKPLTKNKALNKAMRGKGEAVETGPVPLEH